MDDIKGILDKLHPAVRHAFLIFVGSLLTWAAAAARGLVVANDPILDAIISSAAVSVVGTATLWFSKLTKQYGLGASTASVQDAEA